MTFDIDNDTVEVRVDFLCKNEGSLFDNLERLKRLMDKSSCEMFIIQSIRSTKGSLLHDGYGSYIKGDEVND